MFSGTTMVISLRVEDTLYTANLGDSRCVIARISPEGQMKAIPLSEDQTPDVPGREIECVNRVVEISFP